MPIRPSLLVLAAGMATRYGSLKQIDSFGPCGETIIDYSVFDAYKAGFGKIIFVIRESIKEEFTAIIRSRFPSQIPIEFVSQELEILPNDYKVPANRTKPWGTGHAVWIAASKIQEPFAVINGDDFYGYESFKLVFDFLNQNTDDSTYGLVGFKLKNTLSEHGTVSRGLCRLDADENLQEITELTQIIRTTDGIIVKDPDSELKTLEDDNIVSMNLMAFKPSVFPHFEEGLKEFLLNSSNPKAEFYLPAVVDSIIKSGKASVKVLQTPEKWFGVTYPEDKPVAIQNISDLIREGIYTEDLWGALSPQSA